MNAVIPSEEGCPRTTSQSRDLLLTLGTEMNLASNSNSRFLHAPIDRRSRSIGLVGM